MGAATETREGHRKEKHTAVCPGGAVAPDENHRRHHPWGEIDPLEEHQETTETRKEPYRQGHLPRVGQETGKHLTPLTAGLKQMEEAESTEGLLEVLTER